MVRLWTRYSHNFKTMLQIEKLKQMVRRLLLTITSRFRMRWPCSCWERCAVFSTPNCTRATFAQFLHQHSAEGATYIRTAAITLGIGPHFSLLDFIIVLHGFNLLPLMVRAGWEGPLQLTVGPQIFSAFLGPQIYTLTTARSHHTVAAVVCVCVASCESDVSCSSCCHYGRPM